LSNTNRSEELREDNRQLILQLKIYKTLLEEKAKLFIQKRKALMSCQSINLKYLQKRLAAMKFKIEQQELPKEGMRIIRQYREQIEIYEQKKVTLQRQLTNYARNYEQLNASREEVQRVTRENNQLKEKLQRQEGELVQLKAIVNGVDRGQPSTTSTISNLIQTFTTF
jgi:DNA repair exonuclease SbcCD ATPase subunit